MIFTSVVFCICVFFLFCAFYYKFFFWICRFRLFGFCFLSECINVFWFGFLKDYFQKQGFLFWYRPLLTKNENCSAIRKFINSDFEYFLSFFFRLNGFGICYIG